MIKKIIAMANRPQKPVTKTALLRFLLWQIILLCIAFVIVILDFLDIVNRPARVLMVFVLMPLIFLMAAYLNIHEAGLGQDIFNKKTTSI